MFLLSIIAVNRINSTFYSSRKQGCFFSLGYHSVIIGYYSVIIGCHSVIIDYHSVITENSELGKRLLDSISDFKQSALDIAIVQCKHTLVILQVKLFAL